MEVKKLHKKQRNPMLDAMKGFGIVLVVIGHVSKNTHLSPLIYSFHMPLFFFISGIIYTMVAKERYIYKQFKSIIIPYFSFSLLSFLYWIFIENRFRPKDTSIDAWRIFSNIFIAEIGNGKYSFIYNVVLWFLPCLFVSNLILYFLLRNRITVKKCLAFLLAFLFISILLNLYLPHIHLPFTFPQSFFALPFMFFAILIILINDMKIFPFNSNPFLNIIVSLVLFLFLILYPGNANMMTNNYENDNYLLFFIKALIGIYFIASISYLFSKNKIINYLGENSLLIMVLHEPIKRMVIKFYALFIGGEIDILRANIFHILIISALVILVTIPILEIVKRYFPFLIGKKKQRQRLQKLI